MSTNRRLSGRQALAAWPERLAAARTEPSDEGLQRLCSLLDAIDHWVADSAVSAHFARLDGEAPEGPLVTFGPGASHGRASTYGEQMAAS